MADKRQQRVQIVHFDSFEQISFLFPKADISSFRKTYNLYHDFIVPKMPIAFGQMLLFAWDETISLDQRIIDAYKTKTCQPVTMAKMAFDEHLKIRNGKVYIGDETVKKLYQQLKDKHLVETVCGKLPYTKVLPVGNNRGYLSQCATENNVVVNSSLFVMDCFDCVSDYDTIGAPVGLMLKNNLIINPPLFNRETLLVKKDGSVEIKTVNLDECEISIDGKIYRDGINCCLYQRPQYKKSGNGMDIVIVGDKVVGLAKGHSKIPGSGFIMHLDDYNDNLLGKKVAYKIVGDYVFALQVGNSVVIKGEKTTQFKSYFSNIYKLNSVTCPPSLYPLDYQKDRAPRIVLGADVDNKPMLLWFEGEGKFSQDISKESCGVSLSECADLAQQIGLYNGIHLDGGGSAQMIYHQQRMLRMSDRDCATYKQVERAIPCGLRIE